MLRKFGKREFIHRKNGNSVHSDRLGSPKIHPRPDFSAPAAFFHNPPTLFPRFVTAKCRMKPQKKLDTQAVSVFQQNPPPLRLLPLVMLCYLGFRWFSYAHARGGPTEPGLCRPACRPSSADPFPAHSICPARLTKIPDKEISP